MGGPRPLLFCGEVNDLLEASNPLDAGSQQRKIRLIKVRDMERVKELILGH